MDNAEFEKLLARIRSGDEEAAKYCVEYFEPEIRRVARVRLRDPRLQAIADSVDVSQSVFGKFFQTYGKNTSELRHPSELLALLVKMTKNKVIDLARKHKPVYQPAKATPAIARETAQLGDLDAIFDDPGPSSVIASRDLAEHIRRKMTAEEYDIMERRNSGQAWDQIASELDRSADALRKQLQRALNRLRTELNPENL